MNEGALSSELGLTGWPAVAEESIIARDVLLAEHLGARLHICHLSTAGSVEVLRWAKARGIAVTAEVTPHHLLLTEDLVRGYDARFKVNPPLRREEDVLALRQGVAEGLIDIIATDHAPHPSEAKECEWDNAAFGMVGLESAIPVVQTSLIETGIATWADIERMLSQKPAEIGRLDNHPRSLDVGEVADLTLIDPSSTSAFDSSRLRGLSVNTPFTGIELSGAVKYTIRHGYLTFENGELVDEHVVAEAARA
jgi:dihydroorotase